MTSCTVVTFSLLAINSDVTEVPLESKGEADVLVGMADVVIVDSSLVVLLVVKANLVKLEIASGVAIMTLVVPLVPVMLDETAGLVTLSSSVVVISTVSPGSVVLEVESCIVAALAKVLSVVTSDTLNRLVVTVFTPLVVN